MKSGINNIVDIIIPIYNAYEDVILCIDSIFKYTTESKYRLILINDKSPDARIEEYLTEVALLRKSNVIIKHNNENLGFVKTVNKGMKMSNNDIILLNSDTEVTANWLEKLVFAAYSQHNIATVTPLTNSGTICSVPDFCEDNEIPKGITLSKYAFMIEKYSLKLYPSIPTAVGFCMYIKRVALNKVGFFDEESYGKGYGEENDFCCRCMEFGYYHILCDDTFIYHKGSMSFKEDKNKYIKNNLKVLGNKYTYYFKLVEEFIKSNPLKDIQENIKLHIKLKNGKKNIFYVVHNDFIKGRNGPIGGTEFHVKDLVENLPDLNKFVCYIYERELIINGFIDNEIIEFKFYLKNKIEIFTFHNKEYYELIKNILIGFEIDLVHIHHLFRHSFDIVNVAKDLGIPSMITLHDFYLACPTVTFLDTNGVYCVNTRNREMCKECIKQKIGYNTYFLETWNEEVSKILTEFDKIYTPSEAAKEIFENYYNKDYKLNAKLNIEAYEHGVEIQKVHDVGNADLKDGKFRIAFIGGIAPYKGSAIIHDLVTRYDMDNIEWHIFGNLGDQRLNLLEKKNFIKHGRYERADIGELLKINKIDLVGIFAIWPETYSYTLTEAWQAGMPVVATDIGALGERISQLDAGWTLPLHSSTEEIFSKIIDIKNNQKDYNEKLSTVFNLKFVSKQEMAEKYKKDYLEVIEQKPRKEILFQQFNKELLLSYKIANVKLEYCDNEMSLILQERIENLEKQLKIVYTTFGWKLLNVLRSKFPWMKKFGKKMLYIVSRKYYK